MIRSKSMTVAVAALTLCMAAGGAFAQDRRDDRGPGPGDRNGRFEQNHRGNDHRGNDHRGNGHRRDDHRDGRVDRQDFRDGRYSDRRGYPEPHAEWRRGGRVPTEYRGRNYVVDDWRGHRLQPPPRGYQWVGVGGDYVLAAIATGLIAQIIVGSR